MVGISTDNLPTLSHWAQELKLTYSLASDFSKREVARAYGVLNDQYGIANRATFVVGPDGRIENIDEGTAALDPDGAATACKRIRSK